LVLANVDVRRGLDARARGGDDRNTVEKDYALSYLLAGIAAVPDLYAIALFKGGTCLRKAYFENHRFSVDLDYTLTRRLPCDDLQRLIQAAADQATVLLQQRGDFRLDLRVPSHMAEHENGQCEFKVGVAFPWMRTGNCVLKVELLPAPPEVIVGTPEERKLLHVGFDETLDAKMRCYELREIAAEKLRGFLQTRLRFEERDAGKRSYAKSRPRDLFDLAELYRQTTYAIDWPSVRRFLTLKAEPYGVSFTGPPDFLDARVLDDMSRTWNGQLGFFIRPLPTFDECLASFKELLDKTFA